MRHFINSIALKHCSVHHELLVSVRIAASATCHDVDSDVGCCRQGEPAGRRTVRGQHRYRAGRGAHAARRRGGGRTREAVSRSTRQIAIGATSRTAAGGLCPAADARPGQQGKAALWHLQFAS